MRKRKLGPFEVELVGLGCMNLSHAYGAPPPRAEAERLLLTAFDLGVRHFDTAALYGFGANEELVGPTLKPHRGEILLASKCGLTGVDGKRVIDGRPETIMRTCADSLRRLQADVIDLYTLHRWDKKIPVEESVGALARLKEQGKIRAVGLSEISAATLRKAAAVTPIAAVQNEYSLWTRNPEIGLLQACAELGTAFVAFSPLGRGVLTATAPDPSTFAKTDIRADMPRFHAPHYERNLALRNRFLALASSVGVPPDILALAWVLSRGEHVHVIPGTTNLSHLANNVRSGAVETLISSDGLAAALAEAGRIFTHETVSGPRYSPAAQAGVDTEDF